MTNKNYKEQMIPYVPTWEAHYPSAHNLVGKFTKAYCNVPRGKAQSQKYCIAVQSFFALAQQLMGNNKDDIDFSKRRSADEEKAEQLKDKILESLKLND